MKHLQMDSLDFLLAQVVRLHHHRVHMKIGKLGLYPGQPRILSLLREKDGRSQKELAEEMKLKPSTITVMLKRMEKAGMLVRREDPEDLRVSRVYLSEQGRRVCCEMEGVWAQMEEECFEGFTPEEKILLRRFLMHMRNNLQEACRE